MTRFLQDLLHLCRPHWSGLPPQVTVHLCLVLFLTLFSISVLNRQTHHYSCPGLVWLLLPSVALTLTNSSPCVTLTRIAWGLREWTSSTDLTGLQIHMIEMKMRFRDITSHIMISMFQHLIKWFGYWPYASSVPPNDHTWRWKEPWVNLTTLNHIQQLHWWMGVWLGKQTPKCHLKG